MYVVGVVVLNVLVPVGAESNQGGMQTGLTTKQAVGGVAPHCAKLYRCIKSLCCDYGSWLTDKIGQLLDHLSMYKKYSGVLF